MKLKNDDTKPGSKLLDCGTLAFMHPSPSLEYFLQKVNPVPPRLSYSMTFSEAQWRIT